MQSSSGSRGPVELLADEFLARCKRGEKPTIKEYCDRHRGLADEIRDVFEAVLMVEDPARLEVLVPADPARSVPARLVYPAAAPPATIPTSDAVRSVLAHAHHNLGNVFRMEGKFPEALDPYRRALAIYQQLADANPSGDQYPRMLAGTHQGIGVALALAGKVAQGLLSFQKATAICRSWPTPTRPTPMSSYCKNGSAHTVTVRPSVSGSTVSAVPGSWLPRRR